MKIGVHGKDFNRQSIPFITRVFEILTEQKIDIWVSEKFARHLKTLAFKKFIGKTFDVGESLKKLHAFISIGGDGTLLESVTYVGKSETPILGINTGRLGFLATTNRDETERTLHKIFANEFVLDKRALLRLESNKRLFGKMNFALNDFTIVKKDSSSMITVHTYIDGEFLNSYWADGIIVATPTGSTGYSLSCGGPLVFPRSSNFILTPVSPHNLTARPIIVSDTSEIAFEIEGRSKKFLVSLDSRFEVVDDTIRLLVKKEKFHANLIQIEGKHYFQTLRQKLNWGIDARN